MIHTDFQRRFQSIARLYGADALEKFANSHVAIIGLGGVGSWAAEALARSGVGRFTLIDMDDICMSNTNRQIHTLCNTVGQSKTGVMSTRLQAINPQLEVSSIDDFIESSNLEQYLGTGPDFVIDGIDSVQAKIALIVYCKRNKIPLIISGGAGGQVDPSQITRADLTRAYNDPLLAKIRAELRSKHRFSRNPKRKFALPCIFSTEPLIYPTLDNASCTQKKLDSPKLDCNGGLGAVTMVTASFGFQAASYVLAKLKLRACL